MFLIQHYPAQTRYKSLNSEEPSHIQSIAYCLVSFRHILDQIASPLVFAGDQTTVEIVQAGAE